MLPLRKDFTLNLKIWEDRYVLKYLEATAEESTYFYQTVKNTADCIKRLPLFINWLDSLSPNQKKKIIKSIDKEPWLVMWGIYEKISSTRFRTYESKYKDVKSRPKPEGSGKIQGCSASTELSITKATLIPINRLNKDLTLYQRGWVEDGIICNNLNSFKKGQSFNIWVWRKAEMKENPEKYAAQKNKMDDVLNRMKVLDSKKD